MSPRNEHDYVIAEEQSEGANPDQFDTPDEIREWMETKAEEYSESFGGVEDNSPRGRIYVARSIEYQSGEGLTQTGSAPGYHAGTWSLSTCKKTMRGYNTVDRQYHPESESGIRRPKHPFFIAVFGSRDPDYYSGLPPSASEQQNWLASISLVTAGFNRMEDVAEYISKNHTRSALVNRRTGASDSTPRARERGDLHVDDDFSVVYPPAGHQHGPNTEEHCGCSHSHESDNRDPLDHKDNQHDHIKMVADPGDWIAWREPKFAFTGGLTQGNMKLKGDYERLSGNLSIVG